MLGSARGSGHNGHSAREWRVTLHGARAPPRRTVAVCLTRHPCPSAGSPRRNFLWSTVGQHRRVEHGLHDGPATPAPVLTKFWYGTTTATAIFGSFAGANPIIQSSVLA